MAAVVRYREAAGLFRVIISRNLPQSGSRRINGASHKSHRAIVSTELCGLLKARYQTSETEILLRRPRGY